MSNELVAECITHKDSRNIQVRLDYMLLYRNETKAKIIRIMETWTNQKRAEWHKLYVESKEQGHELAEEPPEEALWVTMSYEEFSIFAYGTMNHDNIKVHVDALVEHEHLKRRPHPAVPYGPPQYLLDTDLLQALLNEQEIPSLFDDIGKIKPPRKKRTPQVKYPQGGGKNHRGDPGKIPPPWGENTPPSKNTTKNYKDNPKKEESSTPASLKEYKHRKETDPQMPVVKPPQQTSTSQSQARGTPDVAPSASVASTAQTGVGAELPAMALTAKQIKQQNDRRAKEIWAIIERERHTKYSRTQRELYENSKGMECLLNDEIDDETLVKALGAMDPYQGRNFTLLKFYGWMPNLTAGAGPPSQNGTSPKQDNPTLGISGLPKLHPRKPVYPDPHEQPRKGPRYA